MDKAGPYIESRDSDGVALCSALSSESEGGGNGNGNVEYRTICCTEGGGGAGGGLFLTFFALFY